MKRSLIAAPLAIAALLAGCASGGGTEPAQSGTAAPQSQPQAEQSQSEPLPGVALEGDEIEDMAAVLEEQQQFFVDQQIDPQGTSLRAVTPQQKEFIAAQREYIESQGVAWDDIYEDTYLALTLNACEWSILNRHDVDVTAANDYFATSPIVAAMTGGVGADRDQLAGLASTVAFGTSKVCPADASAWQGFYESLI